MRKLIILWFIALMIGLAGCVEPSLDYFEFTLIESVDTVELNTVYNDPGAKASYGLKTLDVTVVSNTVDMSRVGVYEIIYQASYTSLTQTLKRVVTVVDETPPIIELNPGVDTVVVGSVWEDRGVTVFDASNQPVDVTVSGEVNPQLPGMYVITYYAMDVYGNQSQIDRIVYVIE